MHDRISLLGNGEALRILLLEDSDIDAELVETHLATGAFTFTIDRARSRAEFEAMLERPHDIILADYSLPDIDGISALGAALQRDPETPFVFVSGVVGEDFATHALQQGAVDYVTKRNLRRLRSAVVRAVSEARERRHRQRVEADLRASEAGSRIALRAARLGGWDLDVANQKLVWDDRCRAICGVAPEEQVTPELYRTLIHPDDRDRVMAATARAMQLPPIELSEQFRLVTPDGRLVWIESTGSAIFEDGQCRRFVGVVRDITVEKQAELALLDRTASLQASLEQQVLERHLLWRNSQDLLAVIGPDGRVRDMTPSWQRLLGTALESVIGKPLMGFIHPEDADATRDFLDSGTSLGPRALEARLRHQDGTYRWFGWTALPDVGGVLYANARNIQDEKDAAARVQQVEDTLRQAQKMEAIGQLTGGIAHDFNNMLAGIIGSLDAIRRRIGRQRYDDLERFIEAATTSSQRAAALTQRLLAFSRRQTLDVKSQDVTAVIEGMNELLQRTVGENIRFTTVFQPGLWLCQTDANQLENAVLNLTINARDAMPNGGTLTVEAVNYTHRAAGTPVEGLAPGDYVAVSIVDDGDGMPPEVLAKAFDPFFTTKPIGQGTGLGLSMVYGFVTQVGGHVAITSRPGEGTRITLYFKRSHDAVASQSAQAPAANFDAGGARVLIVEDDPSVRMLLGEALRDLGFRCTEVGSGDLALPIIQSTEPIDLVVSDVGLPGMNGRQLADRVRDVRPTLPILFVTGYAEGVDNRADFLGSGMDMLGKPFSNDQLAEKISSLMGEEPMSAD